MKSAAEPEGAGPPADILVIGYGNPLRGDDALGWHAGDAVEARRLPGVEVVLCQQLVPELALPLSQARAVIFLDAQAAGSDPPGHIHCRLLAPGDAEPAALDHFLDPTLLLSLTVALYGRAPRGLLYTVAAAAMAHSRDLSAPVAAALPQVVGLVVRRIAALRRSLTAGTTAVLVPSAATSPAAPGRPQGRGALLPRPRAAHR